MGTSVRTMELSRRPLTPMEILRLRTQTNKELIGLRKSVYTVVAVDDEYVTLRNPWGHNKPADGYQPPAGDRPDGLIRITREEYEQHFNCADIGSTPR